METSIEKEIIQLRNDYKYQIWDPNIKEILWYLDYDEDDEYDYKYDERPSTWWISWFIPNYQRKYSWDSDQWSQFIESIFLGIPIQYIFLCRINYPTVIPSPLGIFDYEIIDWSQRLRTIRRFVNNRLTLTYNKNSPNKALTRLKSLDWKKFSDLSEEIQNRFYTRRLRVIEIENMDEENRKDMFHRLNAWMRLDPQEQRKWTYEWKYQDFLEYLVNKYDFKKLCPLDVRRERQGKHVEFVLKFFAFWESYSSEIKWTLDIYMGKMTDLSINNEGEFNEMIKKQENDFSQMVQIVKTYVWDFSRPSSNTTSSQRFEGISIGIFRAVNDKNFNRNKLSLLKDFVNSNEFIEKTTIKWWANATKIFNWRVNAVRDFLCE